MNATPSHRSPSIWRRLPNTLSLLLAAVLVVGTWRNPQFWLTADQRGDRLIRERRFAEAAKVYTQPATIGAAQYRNGDFKEAAATFARISSPEGLFNRGNAQLMHGSYDAAIASYDLALARRADWTDAKDNRAIAVARRDKMKVDDKTREAEQADAYKPDKVVVDNRGGDHDKPPAEAGEKPQGEDATQAAWLRRVQTTPGDFLRAKFFYQAAQPAAPKASP
ncbi:MAG: hypothetical protein QM760_21550 [Nibricoccus sp.]